MVTNTSVASPNSERHSAESGIPPGWFAELYPPPCPPSPAQEGILPPPSLAPTTSPIRFDVRDGPPDGSAATHYCRQRPCCGRPGGDGGLTDTVALRSGGPFPGRARSLKRADAMHPPWACGLNFLSVADDREKRFETCAPAETPNRWMNSGPPATSGNCARWKSVAKQAFNQQAPGIARLPWEGTPTADARLAMRQCETSCRPLVASPTRYLPRPVTMKRGERDVGLCRAGPSADIGFHAAAGLYLLQKPRRRICRGFPSLNYINCLPDFEFHDIGPAFSRWSEVCPHAFPSRRTGPPGTTESRVAGRERRNAFAPSPGPGCASRKNAAIPPPPGEAGRGESAGTLRPWRGPTIPDHCLAALPPFGCMTGENALENAIRRGRAANRGREHA